MSAAETNYKPESAFFFTVFTSNTQFPSGAQTRANGSTSLFIKSHATIYSLPYYMLWLRGKRVCRVMMTDSKNSIWL